MAVFSNMALKATQGEAPFMYLGVINDGGENEGYLEYNTEEVLSKNAKFNVEYAHSGLFHVRSYYNNKYWVRSSTNGYWIVAQAKEPEIDEASWTCTLFRLDIDDDKNAKFYHVQSGTFVRIPNDNSARKMFLTIDPSAMTEAVSLAIDYDNLVVFPKLVAFRGSNERFYRTDPSSSFSGTDLGDPYIVCEVVYTSEGYIRVKAACSPASGVPWVYWMYNSSWWDVIEGSSRSEPTNPSQLFAAIKINANTIALRSLANNKLCQRANVEGNRYENCLVAKADGLIADAYLQVVEPLISRSVEVYEFDIDKSRIYGVQLLFSQQHTWDNYTDEDHMGTANGTISTTTSRTYSNSINVSATVTTNFKTGLPFIAESKIEVSATASYTHQWDQTTEDTQEVGDSFTVTAKAGKRTIARGVATKGRCDVPFAYVQKDYPTDGGPPIITRLWDGVFTGANAYGFQSDVRYEELPPTSSFDQAPTGVIETIDPPPPGQ